MPGDPRSTALAYLAAVGDKQFDRVAELLHPDVEFQGPNICLRGADDFVAALRRLGPVVVRNDVRKTFVDGADVGVIYDFVTDTEAGALPAVEWLTVENGLVRAVRLVFHSAPWPAVMAELERRASHAA